MKTIVKKHRCASAKGRPRSRCGFVVKIVGNKKTAPKKLIASDWQHLTKGDMDLIVRQINNPPQQSAAMKKAEELYLSILQMD